MSLQPDSKKQNWVLVTSISFAVFLLLAILLIVYGQNLKLSVPVYFFLLCTMALAATGLLAGALKSQAKYNGKVYGGTLNLGGPVVVFALIIMLGYKFRPAEITADRSITVNLFSAVNKMPVTAGNILIKAGVFSRREDVNTKGEAVFTGIGPEEKGKILRIFPDVAGFTNPFIDSVFTIEEKGNTTINIILNPVEDQLVIRGNVYDDDDHPLVDCLVDIGHGLATVRTDSIGNFSVKLSMKEGVQQDVTVTDKGKVVYRSLRTLSSNTPLKLPAK